MLIFGDAHNFYRYSVVIVHITGELNLHVFSYLFWIIDFRGGKPVGTERSLLVTGIQT